MMPVVSGVAVRRFGGRMSGWNGDRDQSLADLPLACRAAGESALETAGVAGQNGGEARWLFAGGVVKWRQTGEVSGLTGAPDGDAITSRCRMKERSFGSRRSGAGPA